MRSTGHFLKHGLQKQAEDRYESADEVIYQLERVRSGSPGHELEDPLLVKARMARLVMTPHNLRR